MHRVYGGIYELASKNRIYVAYLSRMDIYRGTEQNLSAACDKGIAAWAIDRETIMMMNRKIIRLLAIYVRDEDEVYLTRTAYFLDQDRNVRIEHRYRRGLDQVGLPLGHFVKMTAEEFNAKLSS